MNLLDIKLKDEIIKAAGKHIDLGQYRLFFFGSRVKGTNFPRADIDVGIEGSAPLPVEVKLALADEFGALPTLYKIDLVDFRDVSKKFKKNALKYTEPIN